MRKAELALLGVALTAVAMLVNIVVDALEAHGALYPKLTFWLAIGAGVMSFTALILSVRGERRG